MLYLLDGEEHALKKKFKHKKQGLKILQRLQELNTN